MEFNLMNTDNYVAHRSGAPPLLPPADAVAVAGKSASNPPPSDNSDGSCWSRRRQRATRSVASLTALLFVLYAVYNSGSVLTSSKSTARRGSVSVRDASQNRPPPRPSVVWGAAPRNVSALPSHSPAQVSATVEAGGTEEDRGSLALDEEDTATAAISSPSESTPLLPVFDTATAEARITKALSCHFDGYGRYGADDRAAMKAGGPRQLEHLRPHTFYNPRSDSCDVLPEATEYNDYASYVPPSDPTMVPLLLSTTIAAQSIAYGGGDGGSLLVNSQRSSPSASGHSDGDDGAHAASSHKKIVKVKAVPSIHSRWLFDEWRLWEGELPCNSTMMSEGAALEDTVRPHPNASNADIYASSAGRHPLFPHHSFVTTGSHKKYLPNALYELQSFCIDEDDGSLYAFTEEEDGAGAGEEDKGINRTRRLNPEDVNEEPEDVSDPNRPLRDPIRGFKGVTEYPYHHVDIPTVMDRFLSPANRRVVPLVRGVGGGERVEGNAGPSASSSSAWRTTVLKSLSNYFASAEQENGKNNGTKSSSTAAAEVLFVDDPALIAPFGGSAYKNSGHTFHRIAPFMYLAKLLGVRTIIFATDIVTTVSSKSNGKSKEGEGGNGAVGLSSSPFQGRYQSRYRRALAGESTQPQTASRKDGAQQALEEEANPPRYAAWAFPKLHQLLPNYLQRRRGDGIDGRRTKRSNSSTSDDDDFNSTRRTGDAPPFIGGLAAWGLAHPHSQSKTALQGRGGGGIGGVDPLLPAKLLFRDPHEIVPHTFLGRDAAGRLGGAFMPFAHQVGPLLSAPSSSRDDTFAHGNGHDSDDDCEPVRCGPAASEVCASAAAIARWRRCTRRYVAVNVALPTIGGGIGATTTSTIAPTPSFSDTQGYSASVWNRALKAGSREAKRLRRDIWVAKEQMALMFLQRLSSPTNSSSVAAAATDDDNDGVPYPRESDLSPPAPPTPSSVPFIPHYEWYLRLWRARLVDKIARLRSHDRSGGAPRLSEKRDASSSTSSSADEADISSLLEEYMEEYFSAQLEMGDLRERGEGGGGDERGAMNASGRGDAGNTDGQEQNVAKTMIDSDTRKEPRQLMCYRSAYVGHNHHRHVRRRNKGSFAHGVPPTCSEVDVLRAVTEAGVARYGMCRARRRKDTPAEGPFPTSPNSASADRPAGAPSPREERGEAHPLFSLPRTESERLRLLFAKSKSDMSDLFQKAVSQHHQREEAPLLLRQLLLSLSASSPSSRPFFFTTTTPSTPSWIAALMRRMEKVQNAYDEQIMRYLRTSPPLAPTTRDGGGIPTSKRRQKASPPSSASTVFGGRRIALHYAMRTFPAVRPQPHLRRAMSVVVPSLDRYIDFNFNEGMADGPESEKDFEAYMMRYNQVEEQRRGNLHQTTNPGGSSSTAKDDDANAGAPTRRPFTAPAYTPFRNTRSVQFHRYMTTDLYMGPHGADLHGMAYAKPSALLLEMVMPQLDTGEGVFNGGCFSSMADAKGIGYLKVAGHSKETYGDRTSLFTYFSVSEYRHIFSVATCSWLVMNAVRLTDVVEAKRKSGHATTADSSTGHDHDFLVPWWCRGGSGAMLEELLRKYSSSVLLANDTPQPSEAPPPPQPQSPANTPYSSDSSFSSVSEYIRQRNGVSAFGFVVPFCPPIRGTSAINQSTLNRLQNECANHVTTAAKLRNQKDIGVRLSDSDKAIISSSPATTMRLVEAMQGLIEASVLLPSAQPTLPAVTSSSLSSTAMMASLLVQGAVPFLQDEAKWMTSGRQSSTTKNSDIAMALSVFDVGAWGPSGDPLVPVGRENVHQHPLDSLTLCGAHHGRGVYFNGSSEACGQRLLEWALNPRIAHAAALIADRTLRLKRFLPAVFNLPPRPDTAAGTRYRQQPAFARRGELTTGHLRHYRRLFLRGLMFLVMRELDDTAQQQQESQQEQLPVIIVESTPSPLFVVAAGQIVNSSCWMGSADDDDDPRRRMAGDARDDTTSVVLSLLSTLLEGRRRDMLGDRLQQRGGVSDRPPILPETDRLLVRRVLGLCVPPQFEAAPLRVLDGDVLPPSPSDDGQSEGCLATENVPTSLTPTTTALSTPVATIHNSTLRATVARWIVDSFVEVPLTVPITSHLPHVTSYQFSYGWRCEQFEAANPWLLAGRTIP